MEQRTVVVTGGAQGMGFGIAKRFAEAGDNVVIADLNGDNAQRAADELGGAGAAVLAHQCDVVAEESVREMVNATVARFGGLEVLVNNAGTVTMKLCSEMSVDEWDLVMDVNAKGPFICAREALRVMPPGSSIIN